MSEPAGQPSTQPPARTEAPGGLPALACGILGVTVVPLLMSVVALVLGYRARRRAREEPHRYKDDLATMGIVLGWVGVGLLSAGLAAGLVGFFLALA